MVEVRVRVVCKLRVGVGVSPAAAQRASPASQAPAAGLCCPAAVSLHRPGASRPQEMRPRDAPPRQCCGRFRCVPPSPAAIKALVVNMVRSRIATVRPLKAQCMALRCMAFVCMASLTLLLMTGRVIRNKHDTLQVMQPGLQARPPVCALQYRRCLDGRAQGTGPRAGGCGGRWQRTL